jgi:predicted ester cyclase
LTEIVSEQLLTPRILPGMTPGLEGAKAVHQIILTGFPDYQTVIEDLIAARIRMTGTNTGPFIGIPASSHKVDFTGMYIARIEKGKIVEHWSEEDAISLMRQIGAIA